MTAEMALLAVDAAVQIILNGPQTGLVSLSMVCQELEPKRKQCHVVVLVPGMVDHCEEDYPNWPDYPLKPVLLYEKSFLGGQEKLEADFDSIARCKASQLWTDRNDDRTDCIPHLLFKGDTPYWGGVKRRGIVVTCSGVQPHIDKLIAGIVADILVAMAHAAWKNSEDCQQQVDFLT